MDRISRLGTKIIEENKFISNFVKYLVTTDGYIHSQTIYPFTPAFIDVATYLSRIPAKQKSVFFDQEIAIPGIRDPGRHKGRSTIIPGRSKGSKNSSLANYCCI